VKFFKEKRFFCVKTAALTRVISGSLQINEKVERIYMNLIAKLTMTTAGVALIALGIGAPAQAVTFAESGDAGELLNTAQLVGSGFDKISGTLSDTRDVDLYKIFLPGGLFSASTQGGASFDTQLFLFDSSGKGIVFKDDDVTTVDESTIQATLSAGLYYLGISGWDTSPVSSSGRIFPVTLRGATNNTTLFGPTGPGGGEPLTGWVQTDRDQNGGPYQITLSTSTTSPTTSVPEPASALSLLMFGAVGAGSVLKRKQQQKATAKV
jgi:hypothetical protein